MSVVILYPVGGYYLQLSDNLVGAYEREEIWGNPKFHNKKIVSSLIGYLSGDQVKKLGLDRSFSYYSYDRESFLIIYPLPRWFPRVEWMRLVFNFRLKKYLRFAKERVSVFRLWAREDFIDDLLSPGSKIKDLIAAVARYTFFEDFTLWEHNKETKTFVKICGSIDGKKSFISEQEGSSLNEVLDDDYSCVHRHARRQKYINFKSDRVPYLVRLKLSLYGGESIGVLNLYSSRYGFSIGDRTAKQIKCAVEEKYNSLINSSADVVASMNEFISHSVRCGDPIEIMLRQYVCRIAKYQNFEACSIFIYRERERDLVLFAQYDLLHDGVPSEEVKYPVDRLGSLTVSTFRDKKVYWSYDLKRDSSNSFIYSEKTSLPAVNWIGVPIINSFTGDAVGVIRLKNRYEWNGKDKVISNISSRDFHNIYALVSHISNYVTFISSLNDLTARNNTLNEFARTFMHEVRAPISTFSTAPERISDILRESHGIPDGDKIYMLLKDIEAMGSRLKFFTDCYSLKNIVSSKNIEAISFLEDVYYPVMNISRHYHESVSDINFVIDQSSMHGVKVRADSRFLQIVLNALVDNSVKYCDEIDRIVKIFSKRKDGFLLVYIENTGLGLCDDEIEKVFGDGVRGDMAIDHKIQGNGVGLHLSRKLMREIGGDIYIDSGINPFRIVIKIGEHS